PALALADIGIAMGVAGTDVAVETADVALASEDLSKLLELRDLARRTLALIRQNYGMSITVNAAGLLVSAAGAMSPVVAAILHNASSVTVVANSSRLIRHQLPPRGSPRSAAKQGQISSSAGHAKIVTLHGQRSQPPQPQ
ncbi:MAG TPA: hypothetical protein VFA63_15805, partial [Pseudonocardiaceae bacterium]|nr:hypothetical protein [Pseudonocardiaceae bacterium]